MRNRNRIITPRIRTLVLLLYITSFLGCTVEPSFDYSDEYGTDIYDNGVIFYGDTQGNHTIHMDMVSNIFSFEPKAVFHVGDAVDDWDCGLQWKTFDKIVSELRRLVPFYPVIGNHDIETDLEEYTNRWEICVGKGYYALDLDMNGNLVQLPINGAGVVDYSTTIPDNAAAHLVVLNDISGFLEQGGDQYNWLIKDLLRYAETPTILIYHIGLYMAGPYSDKVGKNHPSPVLYDVVSDARFNIIACVNGHDHSYQRFLVNGVQHIVTGCAGESVVELDQPNHPYLVTSTQERHLSIMKLTGTAESDDLSLHFTAFDRYLNIIDDFFIPLK